MPCLICGASKTIRAHLIPRAFATEVASTHGEKHALIHAASKNYETSATGRYDPDILCASCDWLLGKHEGYVFNLLKQVRAEKTTAGSYIGVNPLEGDTVVKFAAGLCWKYSVTQRSFGRIDIGPYSPILADVAFERSSIPPSIDVLATQLQSGSAESYFYRTPMPDRTEGVNVVRFSVGSFVFFLKIDRRPNPRLFPAECWFRGRSSGWFGVAPAHMFEEWRLHAQAATAPGVSGYFQRMRSRTQSG